MGIFSREVENLLSIRKAKLALMQLLKDEDWSPPPPPLCLDGVMEWDGLAAGSAESWPLEVLHGKDNPRALSMPRGFLLAHWGP